MTPAGRGISIAKVASARHDVSRRGLLVAPSGLIAPHLYVADVPGQPLLLIHPVTPGPPAPPVAELHRRLDIVAHRGRLEVARAIATEPRTAGEIAGLWNLDPTLVNRHLRALAAAGLARPGPPRAVRAVPARRRRRRGHRHRPGRAAAALSAVCGADD